MFGSVLYIVLFLHQTTTLLALCFRTGCCISYYSYIKPQPSRTYQSRHIVVYRTIPTSNHNFTCTLFPYRMLYIVLFLHQTTTILPLRRTFFCCISYYSYIKPQREVAPPNCHVVVYRTIPTSSHNILLSCWWVYQLYIVLFLHQTTTQMRRLLYQRSCISYYSYIKPQRLHWLSVLCIVVYRTIPTSNHNRKGSTKNFTLLYIVLFLHQTTTQENLRQWCE